MTENVNVIIKSTTMSQLRKTWSNTVMNRRVCEVNNCICTNF